MTRALIALSLMASVALADGYGDPHRKSPKPLPPRKETCLKVYSKPRCIPIAREVIDAYGLKSGQSVTPRTMFEIYEENERYRKTKLR